MSTAERQIGYWWRRRHIRRLWWLGLAAFVFYLPSVLTTRTLFGHPLTNTAVLGFGVSQVNFALIAVVGALGLNLLMGQTGLVSLGNAAFFAVGACTAGVVATQWHLGFLPALIAAAAVGGVTGVLIGLPVFRLRGLYLLVSTMGFHFIAVWLFLKYQLHYFGPVGVTFSVPTIGGFRIDTDERWYAVLIACTAAAVVFSRNITKHREGRALIAIRDHELAAGSVGIAVTRTKLKIFGLSSAMVSVAGALYVWYLGVGSSDIFTLQLAIDFVAMVIIGGMGSIVGSVLGALVWQLLPRAISTMSGSVAPTTPVVGGILSKYQPEVSSILLGVGVILVLMFEPDGLSGIGRAIKRRLENWPLE